MNVAASTLLILLLLLPGVAFRRLYYTGEFSKQYVSDDFGQLLLRTAGIALLVHLGAGLPSAWLAPAIGEGYRTIALLVADADDGLAAAEAYPRWSTFAGYYLALALLAGAAGLTAQGLVRRYGLDRRFKLLRFRNHWHYVLRGGVREFAASPTRGRSLDVVGATYIDALVSTSEGDMIYEGLLIDYELAPDNELKLLVLGEVRRRPLRSDRPDQSHPPAVEVADDERYYRITGDLAALPGREIKNYNLRYITVSEDAAELLVEDADGDVTSASYYNQPDA